MMFVFNFDIGKSSVTVTIEARSRTEAFRLMRQKYPHAQDSVIVMAYDKEI